MIILIEYNADDTVKVSQINKHGLYQKKLNLTYFTLTPPHSNIDNKTQNLLSLQIDETVLFSQKYHQLLIYPQSTF